MTFDPTPAGNVIADPSSVLGSMRRIFDTVELAWFKWVIDYDLAKQAAVVQQVWRFASSERSRSGTDSDLAQYKRPALIGLGLAGLIGALVWWRRRRSEAGTPRSRNPRLDRLIERVLEQLARRGYHKPAGQTLRALSARVHAAGDPVPAPLDQLVDRYYAMRFGAEALDLAALQALAADLARRSSEHPLPPRAG